LDIAVLSDDQTFIDVHESTDAMIHAFREIRQATGITDDSTPPDTAMAPAAADR